MLGIGHRVPALGQGHQGVVEAPPGADPTTGRGHGEGVALVDEQGSSDRPALVLAAHQVLQGDADVVEELLGELGVPVDLLDGDHLHPGAVDGQDEHAQPPVLGCIPVRAGQAHGVVGPVPAGRPDLRAVQDPRVAVTHRRRDGPGEVRAPARLRQVLGPELLAPEDGRQVSELLLLGAVLEERHGHLAQRRAEELRHFVGRRLLVEDPLVGCREAPSPVLGRPRDPGEPSGVQPGHQLPSSRHGLVGAGSLGPPVVRAGRQVRGQPGASPQAVSIEVLKLFAHPTISSRPSENAIIAIIAS